MDEIHAWHEPYFDTGICNCADHYAYKAGNYSFV